MQDLSEHNRYIEGGTRKQDRREIQTHIYKYYTYTHIHDKGKMM